MRKLKQREVKQHIQDHIANKWWIWIQAPQIQHYNALLVQWDLLSMHALLFFPDHFKHYSLL